MDHPTLFRIGKCADCGDEFPAGLAGAVSARCGPCRSLKHRQQVLAWQAERYVPIVNMRRCVDCAIQYRATGRDTKSLRCPPCRKADKADWKRRWAEENPEKVSGAKRKWHEANRDAIKSYKHRRRVLARDADADLFIAQDIFERDGWVCQLCSKPLDPAIKFPSNDSPSVDHIIPIALGGTHTLANVQAACMGCNRSKGGRYIA